MITEHLQIVSVALGLTMSLCPPMRERSGLYR